MPHVPCPVLGCKRLLSRRGDLPRHVKTHSKEEKDFLYCHGCPYRTIQLQNLQKHIEKHHSDKARYRCKDPSGCNFGTNNKGSLTIHRKTRHMEGPPVTLDVIMNPNDPVYERESTEESSDSSLSHASASLATEFEETLLEGRSRSRSSIRSPSPLNIDPAPYTASMSSQVVATDTEPFRLTAVETSLQHGDERVFSETEVMLPLADIFSCLDRWSGFDIESDDVLLQGGYPPIGVNESSTTSSTSGVGTLDPYVSVVAVPSAFYGPIPVRMPGGSLGYQQDPPLVHPVPPPHFQPAYSDLDPMGSIMDANILNMSFSAYNAPGPSGYQYQPQLDSMIPVQHSVPSHTYPAPYQKYQPVSWNGLTLGTPQPPTDNALFAVPDQHLWLSDFSVQPFPNEVNGVPQFTFPGYALGPSSTGAYDGHQYH